MAINVIRYTVGCAPWVEEAKEELRKDGSTSVTFYNIPSRSEIRRAVYRYFRGYEIQFNWYEQFLGTPPRKSGMCRVLIGPDRTRSLQADGIEPGSEPIAPRAQALRIGECLPDFLPKPQELPTSHAGLRWCPVCERWLPEEDFNWRDRKHRRRQSYCAACNKLYQRWRTAFLKEHNARFLVDQFTIGANKANPYFQSWLKTHGYR